MFSILSLNIRFGLADDGPNSWLFRKRIFPCFFKKHGADFMGFQEVNDFQTDFLKENLPDYDFIGKREPAPPFWQNNIIFYKKEWKCIFYKHFFLSSTPDIPSRSRKSRWPRQCTMGMFCKGKRTLICINTHFDFDASVQMQSARVIMEQLSKLSMNTPAILIGDFNSPPFCPCYRTLTKSDSLYGMSNLPYFKNAFKPPFPATHHGFTGALIGDHIDWILYRGDIEPEESCVIQNAVNGIYPSDHFPVYARFKWKTCILE